MSDSRVTKTPGQIAYEAHARYMAAHPPSITLGGLELLVAEEKVRWSAPPWDELRETTRLAWETAAEAVIMSLPDLG